MTTSLFFLSHFMTKLPPDTTDHSVFPARNNCSPGFLGYTHSCFSTACFILCTIQESYQGRRCLQGCLLPYLHSPSIALSLHHQLANLHPHCDCEHGFTSQSITTTKHLEFGYFCLHHSPARAPQALPWVWLFPSLSPFAALASKTSCDNEFIVTAFKHAGCREGLPPLCFKPTAWYLHWVSVTVGALSE